MPRRHRSARERTGDPDERPIGAVSATPLWAQAEGFVVHSVAGQRDKTYRCPGCHQEIRPGTPHLVVIPEGDVEGRRHWHTPCWRSELRRAGRA